MLVLFAYIGLFAARVYANECPLTDYALEFPNKDVTDYVHIWGMPNLTEFTVCFWMKSSDNDHGTPFSYAVLDQSNELLIIGYDSFNVRIGNTLRELSVSANDGYWHHICASWENTAGSLSFYKDGVLSANHTNFKTGYMIRSGGSLVLGQDQDSLAGGFQRSQSFQGLMTNLNVWDYVLCQNDIARISKACLHEEPGTVYKWTDLKHGVKGKPRVLVPSPCVSQVEGSNAVFQKLVYFS
ncbi:neuronal pentraxin-1-like [Oculina patagonica]